jgi:hypothetical protein
VSAAAPTAAGTRAPGRRPATTGPLLLAAVGAAALGLFFALPYYANGLHRYPLEEVASGLHDPKDLWPFDLGAVGGVFLLGAFVTMAVTPLVTMLAAGWAGFEMWRARALPERRRTVALGVLAIALAALTWVWSLSPLGAALSTWLLD